jgi:ABC-type microcin C transport system duplicated ATPase subunit YejF
LLVDKNLRRHPAEFEDLDLLSVQLQNPVAGIGESGEGQLVFAEVFGELLGVFRADHQEGDLAFQEVVIILAQLRQMCAAEGSSEAPVEDQQDGLLAVELG